MKIRERPGRPLVDANGPASDLVGKCREAVDIQILEVRLVIGAGIDAYDVHESLLLRNNARASHSPARGLRISKTRLLVKPEAMSHRVGGGCTRCGFSLDFGGHSVR
jgi:hypothetical protein